jgi:hypothetical protein
MKSVLLFSLLLIGQAAFANKIEITGTKPEAFQIVAIEAHYLGAAAPVCINNWQFRAGMVQEEGESFKASIDFPTSFYSGIESIFCATENRFQNLLLTFKNPNAGDEEISVMTVKLEINADAGQSEINAVCAEKEYEYTFGSADSTVRHAQAFTCQEKNPKDAYQIKMELGGFLDFRPPTQIRLNLSVEK